MKNMDVKQKKILVQGHNNVSNITMFWQKKAEFLRKSPFSFEI